jgi:putative hemolysin
VFHELLNKRGDRFDFVIGQMIPVEQLEGDINEVTRAIEAHTVHDLKADGDARFQPVVAPAEPEMAEAHSFR